MTKKKPDFSSKATHQAVLKETLQHPVTLAGGTLGALATSAALLFSLPPLALWLGASGLTLAGLSFLVNYFGRRDVFSARYIEAMHQKLKALRKQAIDQIHHDLTELMTLKGGEEYIEQAKSQFQKSHTRYQTLEGILGRKFSTSELAYGRYRGTGEQVYMNILDNLSQIIDLLQSIKEIDLDYIAKRLDNLKEKEELDPSDIEEQATLSNRLALRERQLDKVNELLTRNEEALTVMDETSAAIAQVPSGDKKSKQALQSAMKELAELADRAQHYHSP